jgi:hypothetical protein
MRSTIFADTRPKRLLLLAAALFVAVLVTAALATPAAAETTGATGATLSTGPTLLAQDTTTSTTQSGSATTSTAAPDQAVQSGHVAIIPPSPTQVPLNPGWKTEQMDIRVMPEYDQPAVLVIMGFSLPASVPLPATLKFPIPAGAQITGIGEIDPNGNFTYNYANSYPQIQQGTDWDIASIEVKNYRQLQIDYYYDPGFPKGAGQRAFQILAQMPLDVGQLLLHVQQPAKATDFQVEPALQGSGKADDGFIYSVATYSDVKAGSTMGHIVSYVNPTGGLSVDSQQSGATTQSNTNTVLLAAILVIVVIVGGLVVYRLFFSPRGAGQGGGGRGARRRQEQAARSSGGKQQKKNGQASKAAATGAAASQKGASPQKAAASGKGAAAREDPAAPKASATADSSTTEAPATEAEEALAEDTSASAGVSGDKPGDEAVEYCTACGEELTTESPFCPKCGEARP